VPEEKALFDASWTLRLVVARIEQASRELEVGPEPADEASREAAAARLDARAAEIESVLKERARR
jgi:hypothetical protein